MFSLQLLDIAIGMIFAYLALSILCSGIAEWISRRLDSRAKNLWKWLDAFFSDPDLFEKFESHALIKGLTQPAGKFGADTGRLSLNRYIDWLSSPGKKPSYISSRTFTLALWDIAGLNDRKDPSQDAASIRKTIEALRDPAMKQILLALVDDAGDDIVKARQNIEGWFDDSMDRLSGWYKRRAQVLILALAIGVSIGMNVDTIRLVSTLYRDATVRAAVVAAAQRAAAQSGTADSQAPLTMIDQVQQELQQLNLPVGWSDPKQHPSLDQPFGLLVALIGWLITGFAVSQGAPFWFDLLNKLVNVRSTGQPPPSTTAK
jgi:hypothetical protein